MLRPANLRNSESPAYRKSPMALSSFPWSIDLYGWLCSSTMIRPGWVVSGLVIGFLVCCVSGRIMANANFFEDFHRFHNFINPTSNFYPTVSEMISIAEANSRPDQTIVIIGGNSIFYGFGQNSSELWSDSLQRIIGANYAVCNFAMPSAEPFEGAYWTAEALIRKGRKVIYATVAHPAITGSPEGSRVYGYAYWDARGKRLLYHDKSRDCLIESRISGHSYEKQQRILELKLCMQLDSLFYFEDLWTALGYLKFFTVWSEPTAANPFAPRRCCVGEQYSLVPIAQRVRPEFVRSLKSDYSACFEGNSTEVKSSFWTKMSTEASALVPSSLKRHCLVVVASPMPRYLSMLDELERSRELQAFRLSEHAWSRAGYNHTNFREQLMDNDYSDGVHLAPSGGCKVAEILAVSIRSISSELGYGR